MHESGIAKKENVRKYILVLETPHDSNAILLRSITALCAFPMPFLPSLLASVPKQASPQPFINEAQIRSKIQWSKGSAKSSFPMGD